ncbi:hypothetical protein [Janthinobacterium sp. HH01]|uniref:hypothetical protein n=1 Tax=Janthinobacterium sp. HH01 TaxID=1198452 RepID=UPI002570AA48|nr:hypothetical protein [Janthinobacterium sp. HH01]
MTNLASVWAALPAVSPTSSVSLNWVCVGGVTTGGCVIGVSSPPPQADRVKTARRV